MGCDEALSVMDAYLDSETDALAAAEIFAHLGECPACASAFRAAGEAHEKLNEALASKSADGALWDRIERQLAQAAPRRPHARVLRAAAVLALAALLFGSWRLLERGRGASLVKALEKDHLEFLAGEFGPAFHGEAPPQVIAASGGRVGQAAFASLPRLAGFRSEGSRLCYLSGVPVAWTLGIWRGRQFSWVAFRKEELARFADARRAFEKGDSLFGSAAGGFQFAARMIGGHVVCALGELERADLEALLRSVPEESAHG